MKSPIVVILDTIKLATKFVTLTTDQLITGIKRFGGDTSYSSFESDGTYVATGAATTWKDINVGGVTLTLAAANQPSKAVISTTNILTYFFDGSSLTNEVHGAFELQHDYKVGSDIVPHVHWYAPDANAGNVKWNLEYWIKDDGDTAITGTSSVTTAAPGVAWYETRSSFPTITGTNLKIGSQIHFRLYRNASDAADTYASNAGLGTVGVHYECDTLGSRQITTK